MNEGKFKQFVRQFVKNLKGEFSALGKSPTTWVRTRAKVLTQVAMVMLLGLVIMSPIATTHAAAGDCVGGNIDTTGDGIGDGDPCLMFNTSTMISALFDGANTMIQSLGGIYYLLAGFSLGMVILGAIVMAIKGIRI